MTGSALPEGKRAQVSELIATKLGLHFPPARWLDLERGLTGAARELGLGDAAACVEWLLGAAWNGEQLEVLAGHLTVGETYFFRERNTFEALAQVILPELIHSRRPEERRLRIWSAGCCTGEEPYSLAILLQQVIPDLPEWHVTILATDVNKRFLQKAAAGVYSKWSFRDAPAGFKEKYFHQTADGHYAILPTIKNRVTFAQLNLVDDATPSLAIGTHAMDLIFCRNVLMYFTPGQTEKVVGNLQRALREGGLLAVSAAEGSPLLRSHFEAVNLPGVVLYRKAGREAWPAPALPGTEPGSSRCPSPPP